jgi:hypothetical protein
MIGDINPTVCIEGNGRWKVELCRGRCAIGQTGSRPRQREHLTSGENQTDFVIERVSNDQITITGDRKPVGDIKLCRGALSIEVPLTSSGDGSHKPCCSNRSDRMI